VGIQGALQIVLDYLNRLCYGAQLYNILYDARRDWEDDGFSQRLVGSILGREGKILMGPDHHERIAVSYAVTLKIGNRSH